MSEENTNSEISDSGAVSDGEGGQGSEAGSGNQDGASNERPKAVPLDVHKQTLDQFHTLKSQFREQQDRLDEALGTVESLKTQGLREKEDYKALYERESTARQEAQEKLERQRTALFNSERHRAVFPELKKAGLRDDAENLVNLHDWAGVDVDLTSNGLFNVSGVDSAIETFKNSHPYAFEKPKAPRVNGSPGSGGVPSNGELTAQKVIEIENECRKSGNMQPYKEAVAKYKAQRAQPGRH